MLGAFGIFHDHDDVRLGVREGWTRDIRDPRRAHKYRRLRETQKVEPAIEFGELERGDEV